jgi:REP element-mobilizing transposase RayT
VQTGGILQTKRCKALQGLNNLQMVYRFFNLALSRCITNLINKTMSSYRQLLYHLVFRTKESLPTIRQDNVSQLYAYITGIIKNKNSHLYRINGTENHLHIFTDLHPSVALADFMRELKVSTSMWMKDNPLFPKFDGWAEGYGSFTCSYMDMGSLIEYIKNQQEHHRKKTFEEEYRNLLLESGIKIDERYFP